MGKSKHEVTCVRKRIPTPGPYSPIQMKEGEILTDVNQEEWRIGKPLGGGGFGIIYLVSEAVAKPVPHDALYAVKMEPHRSGPLFVERNFYIRVGKKEMIEKWKKDRGMSHMGMPHYITSGSHEYQNEKYRFLILKRFGLDIGKMLTKCKGRFHIKTVLTLGVQILDILEYIHAHGYIHVDVKGSNLLLGHGKGGEDTVYLLDYGLACRYVDSTGEHKEYNPDQRKAHDGTLEYTSRDAHVGAHSRRGDLEVLGYNLVQWLSGGLPWEHETDPERVAHEKTESMDNIDSFLGKCFGSENPPDVLTHYLRYVASLQFEEDPDYEDCRTLLRRGIRQAGYVDDCKLNLTTAPTRLLKKRRIDDVENWPKLKRFKKAVNARRKPCGPAQLCNRMTRQQTAANTVFELRSKERFDWVKVLQSNPEKMFAVKRTREERCKRIKKKTVATAVLSLKKQVEDPWLRPTPAMLEVVKLRNKLGGQTATPSGLPGRRSRSDSHSNVCTSPVMYAENTLTPAMEEVIRRREILQRLQEISFKPIETAAETRARRTLNTRTTRRRKTSAPVMVKPVFRPRTRKYSLPEESQPKKHAKKRSLKKSPTSPKAPKRKIMLHKSRRNREVSPSEVDFVPRLRTRPSQRRTHTPHRCLRGPATVAQAVPPAKPPATPSPASSIRHFVSSFLGPVIAFGRMRSAYFVLDH